MQSAENRGVDWTGVHRRQQRRRAGAAGGDCRPGDVTRRGRGAAGGGAGRSAALAAHRALRGHLRSNREVESDACRRRLRGASGGHSLREPDVRLPDRPWSRPRRRSRCVISYSSARWAPTRARPTATSVPRERRSDSWRTPASTPRSSGRRCCWDPTRSAGARCCAPRPEPRPASWEADRIASARSTSTICAAPSSAAAGNRPPAQGPATWSDRRCSPSASCCNGQLASWATISPSARRRCGWPDSSPASRAWSTPAA